MSHQLNGVRIIDSYSTYIDENITIGSGTIIYPGTVITGNCNIGQNVILESGSTIKNSIIGSGSSVKSNCYLDQANLQEGASIGPFAHLRPGSEIGKNVKIGNFVEVKKSVLKEGSKVSHLSYVGDAEIGERTNIGCGFITCNYDGKDKHKTKIGKDAFIGSDSQTIAPVEIGDDAYVASGSTINKDVGQGDFAIARSKQTVIKNGAKRFAKK